MGDGAPSGPTTVIDHWDQRITVACAMCSEHVEMPWDGPLPSVIPFTREVLRFNHMVAGFSQKLSRECRYLETLRHHGRPMT